MSIKLLVADHQEVMRAGLKSLIARSTVEISDEASSERDLLRIVQKQAPDVVILDVRFAGEDGFSTLTHFRRKFPDIPVLIWATGDNPTYIARAMALGARGYLSRSLNRNELLQAIRTVANGRDAWTAAQIEQFADTPRVPEGVNVPLTVRELEVVRQISYGLSNKEVALALGISYETVKEHVQHILRKLKMTDRTQAAVWAVRNGLDGTGTAR